MKIAIIGAGGVGSTLGHAWRRRGHEVTYGVPEPHAAKYASLDGDVTTNQHAAKAADAVVLCTPWQATEQALADCGDSAGKVLIDCINPLSPDSTSLGSGTARPAPSRWPVGRRVRGYVKALNQIGAPMMDAPALSATPVMFVCGDDVEAKTITTGLVAELDFEVVDAGDPKWLICRIHQNIRRKSDDNEPIQRSREPAHTGQPCVGAH